MEATATDGARLWWDADGHGEAVGLIPGRGDSTDLFPVRFTDALVAAGFTVLRFDPRDTGLSGDGGDTYTLSQMADDVIAVLDSANCDRAHLIGVSMGQPDGRLPDPKHSIVTRPLRFDSAGPSSPASARSGPQPLRSTEPRTVLCPQHMRERSRVRSQTRDSRSLTTWDTCQPESNGARSPPQ